MYFKNLPNNLKPREKASLEGIDKLTDIELLAIFLRSGTKSMDVLDLSKTILAKYNGLAFLYHANIEELTKINGIGKIKAIELLSLFEFAKRIKISTNELKLFPSNADEIAKKEISYSGKECFLILISDRGDNFIYKEIMYKGTIKNVNIDPKELISLVLKKDGYKFYCYHNHPSGSLLPSAPDISITKRIKYYSDLFGIDFIYHKIINKNGQTMKIN